MNTIDAAAQRYWRDPTFGPGWFLWDMRLPSLIPYPELEFALSYARKGSRGNIFEIGTAWGASSLAMSLVNQERKLGEKVITCDPYPDDNWEASMRATAAITVLRREPDVVYMCCTSQEISTLFAPESFRLTLVDGSHSREWIEKDAKAAIRLTRKGGFILFHDYNNEVKIHVDSLLRNKIVTQEGIVGSLLVTRC